MSEIDRIIGRLEEGFAGLNTRLRVIEKKVEALHSDYHQRKGASRFASFIIGGMGGILTHVITKLINN